MAKTTKKPTAKQLAARKKFAAMAKARAKAAKAKKPTAKKTAAKKTTVKKTSIYQTGTSDKLYDSRKKAQGPGKRVSVDGNVYYERRKNRSDMPGSLTGIISGIGNIGEKFTRVNNDVYGNPRYVIHFLEILNDEERITLPWNKKFTYAVKKANKIGGKKFDNKQYGGGIVFQSYNIDDTWKRIQELKNKNLKIKI